MTTPTPARRLQHAAYGGPEVLELAEVPLPEPGPGQVRVRVHAAGVNALDSKKRRGLFAPGQEAPAEPQTLGLEMAGVIDALGPGVTQWKTGLPVLGLTAQPDALATHALADADNLVAKPDALTFEQAAALPVATETAYPASGEPPAGPVARTKRGLHPSGRGRSPGLPRRTWAGAEPRGCSS
ncbi:alcohol dehydrogenase catalytic domain-containing protein [Streptomyces sp. Edi2]|uniref:quinone oxidoreductase family protein n=1 Tax=Streptomyces sp. Edi2 TaxID=3162528 RepID=UPI0033055D0F